VGGLFTVRVFDEAARLRREPYEPMPLDGKTVFARGRGVLHRRGALLVGDLVEVSYDDTAFARAEDGRLLLPEDGGGISVDRVCDRKNALIRPPMANLDVLFVTLAAASPDPMLETVDKLISIAEFNGIEPVIVITKSDLNPTYAEELEALYRRAGFETLRTGMHGKDGREALMTYINNSLDGKVAAFSGASGVGKSTVLNALFPSLSLETGEISRRIERGKNTTRSVELYPLSDTPDCGFLADTPGFTMLDFERFDFFTLEDLPHTLREFTPYLGKCRYTDCMHLSDEGCAILEAVQNGDIPRTRHEAYKELYAILKEKKKYK
jgi:ribosome biogenesis GTPase